MSGARISDDDFEELQKQLRELADAFPLLDSPWDDSKTKEIDPPKELQDLEMEVDCIVCKRKVDISAKCCWWCGTKDFAGAKA